MCEITKDDLVDFLGEDVCLNDIQLDAALGGATRMLNKAKESCLMGISDEDAKVIHLYLAAHYSVPFDQSLSMKSNTDSCIESSATFTGQFGKGLESTTFGQQANNLSCGCLAELGKEPVSVFSIGTLGSDHGGGCC